MSFAVHDAVPDDLEAINAIYNYFVEHSTATYQEAPLTAEERLAWWRAHGRQYPVLVLRDGAETVGWASLNPYGDRRGYRFTARDSIYLRADVQGRGWGKRLLSALLERGAALGFRSVIAGISADQTPSLRLHAALGFTEVGRLREIGYKFDRWLDVVFMQYLYGRPAV